MEINRELGAGIKISKLGYGAWAVGNAWTPESDAFDVLDAYLANGGNFVDTAQGYKVSEERIGKYLKLRGNSNKVVISSKTPNGGTMETVKNIESAVDDSLKKLGRDYIDLYFFHSPPDDDETIACALAEMERLVKKGKILTIGASIKGPNVSQATVDLCKKYIDTGKIHAIQLIYSLLRQKNADIFEYANKNGVALVGRTSLESGFLTGKNARDFRFPDEDYRAKWNRKYEEIWDTVARAQEKYAKGSAEEFKRIALQFAMNPEEITTTIVGARNKEQMEGIIAISQHEKLSADLLGKLKSDFEASQNVCNPDF
ncbi:MAG: aldo/keto reductase [Bacillota bacterium]